LITGPMFSGKTDLLLDRVEGFERVGHRVAVVRPAADTRSPDAGVASHSGRTHDALAVASPDELERVAADAIAIDELHFFPDSIITVVERLLEGKTIVVAAGLDLDFRRQPFAVTAALRERADVTTELQGTCRRCGRPSTVTQRLVEGRPAPLDDAVLRPGADDLYEPRCVDCWERERQLEPAGGASVRRQA
jgi:thymidine kinase